MNARPAAPPERLELGDAMLLRRHCVEDAEAIAQAVAASLPELRLWMPWASDDSADPEMQRRRIREADPHWQHGTDFSYVIVLGSLVLGAAGLHARIGHGALELGYWVRSDQTGLRIGTRAAGALTEAALQLRGVDRVEIHCDAANARSAAIARKLGYRLDRTEVEEIAAPAEIGRSMIWVYPP